MVKVPGSASLCPSVCDIGAFDLRLQGHIWHPHGLHVFHSSVIKLLQVWENSLWSV